MVEWIDRHANLKDGNIHQQVVRHGWLPKRAIVTCVGLVRVIRAGIQHKLALQLDRVLPFSSVDCFRWDDASTTLHKASVFSGFSFDRASPLLCSCLDNADSFRCSAQKSSCCFGVASSGLGLTCSDRSSTMAGSERLIAASFGSSLASH